ncbi:MAG TPA: gentisate 1,2-dioxygenase [Blastocatellia bacterium]|nr:gentisate 1,2-dioxygenase [Blastocatellia bacterium]
MQQATFMFIDRTGLNEEPLRFPEPVVIKNQAIDAEVERLASLPEPKNGRRVSMVVHPETGVGNGLTHGIAVAICVLKPGERTRPIRHNSSLVNFCICGSGRTTIGGKRIDFKQYDAWTTPPWSVYEHLNDSSDLQVRLTYSNSPMLEKLNVHIVDENPAIESVEEVGPIEANAAGGSKESPFGVFQLTEDGAWLMPYEKLINPGAVELKPLHWSWEKVKSELDRLRALGKSYVGRRLYLLYDPATGRTNGTTNNFFATITIRPGNIVDRPHRHVSAAVNYYFAGSGYSVVQGTKYEWEAGDLMLSAPGWAIHNHASKVEDVYELTIQDQPVHIAMGSLLWQEDLKREPKLLGVDNGFITNRAAVVK